MKMKRLYEDMERATPQQKERIWEVVDDVFEEIEHKFPDYYRKYKRKIKNILEDEYGEQSMTEHEAREHVSMLKNHDGTRGEHWDKKTIKGVVDAYPQLHKYPFWDTYYALNAVYSKFYDPSYTVKNYVKMATQLLGDGEQSSRGFQNMRGYEYDFQGSGYGRTGGSYNRGGSYNNDSYNASIGFINANRGEDYDYDRGYDRKRGYGNNYRQDGRGEGRDPFARFMNRTY